MLRSAGRMTLAGAMVGALALGGCATTESVKRAQATADQALSTAQGAQAAASHAQSTADAAGAAAAHAESTAEAAGSAAAAAMSQAQAAGAQVNALAARIDQIQQQIQTRRTHRRHRAPAGAHPGERG